MFRDDYVAIFDVDGTFTDGKMYHTEQGKFMKAFSVDDVDGIKELQKYIQVCMITADESGFPIVKKRMEKCDLRLVTNNPKGRWEWIKSNFPDKKIIYMGDGFTDFYCLEKSDFAITTHDALPHNKIVCSSKEYVHKASNDFYNSVGFVTGRVGGNRAVAEACIWIFNNVLDIKDWKENIG